VDTAVEQYQSHERACQAIGNRNGKIELYTPLRGLVNQRISELVNWFRQKTADLRLRYWLLSIFRPKAKNVPSIIRATCVFDAKKVLDSRYLILVTRCGKGS